MKVSIIGTGYVGLVSGTCLAEIGHDVVCVDLDQSKVDAINQAKAPIYEEGLDELLQKNVGCRLRATTDLDEAILSTEATLIAVGTPFDGNEIDLSYIEEAAAQIGRALKEKPDWHMVTVKSTVVPGTTEDVVLPILERESGRKAGRDFGVGMNPEFLREGDAISDFMSPDRIVLGGIERASRDSLKELYAPFSRADILETDPRTAEMIKYTANSLLATMISFSNEIANLCSEVGNIDVVDVMKGVHLDKRLTPILETGERIVPAFTSYLEAGCGFGGSCFPKDVKALAAYGKSHGSPMRMLESVVEINRDQPLKMIAMLKNRFPDLRGMRVALLGIAFKPGSDDIRESPALVILESLLKAGAEVQLHDPVVDSISGLPFLEHAMEVVSDLSKAISGADAVLITTRWQSYAQLPEILQELDDPPHVIDGRRMLEKTSVSNYSAIGLASDWRQMIDEELCSVE